MDSDFGFAGFTFSQLSPTDPDSFVPDWQTGMVTIDYNRLQLDGFPPGGFIQVVEYDPNDPSSEAFWVVQNLPGLRSGTA